MESNDTKFAKNELARERAFMDKYVKTSLDSVVSKMDSTSCFIDEYTSKLWSNETSSRSSIALCDQVLSNVYECLNELHCLKASLNLNSKIERIVKND